MHRFDPWRDFQFQNFRNREILFDLPVLNTVAKDKTGSNNLWFPSCWKTHSFSSAFAADHIFRGKTAKKRKESFASSPHFLLFILRGCPFLSFEIFPSRRISSIIVLLLLFRAVYCEILSFFFSLCLRKKGFSWKNSGSQPVRRIFDRGLKNIEKLSKLNIVEIYICILLLIVLIEYNIAR